MDDGIIIPSEAGTYLPVHEDSNEGEYYSE